MVKDLHTYVGDALEGLEKAHQKKLGGIRAAKSIHKRSGLGEATLKIFVQPRSSLNPGRNYTYDHVGGDLEEGIDAALGAYRAHNKEIDGAAMQSEELVVDMRVFLGAENIRVPRITFQDHFDQPLL